MREKLFSIVTKVTIFTLIFAMSLMGVGVAQAAQLTSVSDTLSTYVQSTVANHSILFTTPTGVALGETITLVFSAGFTMNAIDSDDVEVKDDGVSLTDAADCSGVEKAGIALSGQTVTITICAGDAGTIAASSIVTILVGLNAAGGDTPTLQVTNPGTSSGTITIAGTMADDGAVAIPFLADETIDVSGTVDPSITFTLSATSCALGTIVSGTASTCTYNITTATNATGGLKVYSKADDLMNVGAPASDDIDNVVSTVRATVEGGRTTEEYGFSITSLGAGRSADITDMGTNYVPVPTTTTLTFSTSVEAASVATAIKHAANISATTPAGIYSQVVTWTAVATF